MTRDGAGVTRRTVLLGMAALPVVAACSPASTKDKGPDPLIALADAARADAVRAAAVASSTPALAPRLGPLRDARTRHAAALDAEVARLDAGRAPATPAATPAPAPAGDVTPAALRSALAASAQQAATAALTVTAARAGLVASVAACCAAYAEALA